MSTCREMLTRDSEVEQVEPEGDGLECFRGIRSALLLYSLLTLITWLAWRVW